uniref:Melanotropin gamma n=3 Tax=Bilateria TaxID=33213 RepID=MLG_THETS|nr:RecName: Full=Melanotropin gamma; AltName: Full=Gamma-melanocyte-stimulating hormone; Short=Gamma-MSH [Theromyzon tessulatum]AAB31282.1 gamma-MSH-like peptide=gamma-melanocyte stimulating hormone-like peptide [Theromyzon tessulatum=leeches, brain, Peptide, 11 aa] [Theromyzon tessulatum]
YVMGHFRWDKF